MCQDCETINSKKAMKGGDFKSFQENESIFTGV